MLISYSDQEVTKYFSGLQVVSIIPVNIGTTRTMIKLSDNTWIESETDINIVVDAVQNSHDATSGIQSL
jgi:hypothetical protein